MTRQVKPSRRRHGQGAEALLAAGRPAVDEHRPAAVRLSRFEQPRRHRAELALDGHVAVRQTDARHRVGPVVVRVPAGRPGRQLPLVDRDELADHGSRTVVPFENVADACVAGAAAEPEAVPPGDHRLGPQGQGDPVQPHVEDLGVVRAPVVRSEHLAREVRGRDERPADRGAHDRRAAGPGDPQHLLRRPGVDAGGWHARHRLRRAVAAPLDVPPDSPSVAERPTSVVKMLG